MNNTINEMKNTLQGISSRLTEAEGQISELEVSGEITVKEQIFLKKHEKKRGHSEKCGTTLNAPTLELKWCREKREGQRKNLKRY